jgi:hypothetical protein
MLIIIGIGFGVYLTIRKKIRNFTSEYFGTSSLKEAFEKSEIESSSTPKSLSSMESLYLDRIKREFPDLNINELKAQAEKNILECFNCIEAKNIELLKIKNEKVSQWVQSKIEDINTTIVHFDSIKFHRTVINKYENLNGIATLYLQTSFEYVYKKGDEAAKKIQDRVKTEFIYIIDEDKVSEDKKGLGLNCPNCGAPVSSIGNKVCNYCGSGIVDIVKRSWSLNNISEF